MKTTDEVVSFLHDTYEKAARGAIAPAHGIFASAYYRVTLEVIARIGAGMFEDPGWLADFDIRFARKYREALAAGSSARAPWRIANAAAASRDKRALRHLLLGINAHMAYDLCMVLLDGLVDDRRRRRRDFDAVNRVMHHAIDPVQAIVETRYAEWLARADGFGLGIDEVLTVDRFTRWRTRAWEDAMAILDGRLRPEDVESRVAWRARMLAVLPM